MAEVSLEDSNPSKRPNVLSQWIATAHVFLLAIVIGLAEGWSPSYLAKFESTESELPVTSSEASWIAAIIGIGRIFGVMVGVTVLEKFGSKDAVLYSGIPLILGWLCLLSTNSVTWIYVSRVLSGIAIGMYYSTHSLYIGEISYPKIRGSLVSLTVQGPPVGYALGIVIGAYTPMWVFSCAALVPNVAFVVLFYMKPKSPQYLVLKDRLGEAKRSLEWYNRGIDVTEELQSIKEFTYSRKDITYMDKFRAMAIPVNYKAVATLIIAFILIQLGGVRSMYTYMQIILKNAGVNVIEPALVIIIVSFLEIVVGWTTTYTNDACGRTILLGLSSLGVAISFAGMGVTYQLLDLGFDSSRSFMQWLPIAAVITFGMSFSMGMIAASNTLMSELFSPNIKSIATLLISVSCAACGFITTKSYQPLVDLLTEKYVFWIYSVIMLILAAYSIFFIPETKGKSLVEIQEILLKKEKDPTDTATEENQFSEEFPLAANHRPIIINTKLRTVEN